VLTDCSLLEQKLRHHFPCVLCVNALRLACFNELALMPGISPATCTHGGPFSSVSLPRPQMSRFAAFTHTPFEYTHAHATQVSPSILFLHTTALLGSAI